MVVEDEPVAGQAMMACEPGEVEGLAGLVPLDAVPREAVLPDAAALDPEPVAPGTAIGRGAAELTD
jgi:hypothetical protein